jgi:hypothetical protein
VTGSRRLRDISLPARVRAFIVAVQRDDQETIEAVLRLSRSRRLFAPLAFAVGALAMLIDGLRMVLGNWRLTLVQLLPAVWIWLAMFDLRAHALHGKSFHALRGPVLIPIGLAVIAVTVACFFLNAVFAFAIAGSRPPKIGTAVVAARAHITPVAVSGGLVGAMLACAVLIVPRWGHPWFVLLLGVVIGVMTLCYVAVPARLIGMRTTHSTRDKLTASALTAVLSATVCTPPYVLGRIGILMLGSRVLLIPGIVFLTVGFALQAGATGAVRAIKLSATLTAGVGRQDTPPAEGEIPPA